IQLNGTSTALREPAAEMRVAKPKLVAQGVEQRHVGVGVYCVGFAVDGNGEALAHGVQLPEQDYRPGCLRPTLPFSHASGPTLAGERLVPQTSLENTCRHQFGVNITETEARSEASRNLR